MQRKEVIITAEEFAGSNNTKVPVVRRKGNETVKYYCVEKIIDIKFKKESWSNEKHSPYKTKCIIEYMLQV
jgi:hypothetical protein